MKFTSGMKDIRKVNDDVPVPKEAKHLYFVINDGYVHGTASAIYRLYTNGTGLEFLIGDEFIKTGLIATAVAVEPANPVTNSSGYLYVATSRTEYSKGGCIVYRCPLDGPYNDSYRETIITINGSKILALALDNVNITYSTSSEDEGWGWYWYALIGLGGVFVLSLAWMAVKDLIKACGRKSNDDLSSSQDEQFNDKNENHYYPPAHVAQQYGNNYPSAKNSLNQQYVS